MGILLHFLAGIRLLSEAQESHGYKIKAFEQSLLRFRKFLSQIFHAALFIAILWLFKLLINFPLTDGTNWIMFRD